MIRKLRYGLIACVGVLVIAAGTAAAGTSVAEPEVGFATGSARVSGGVMRNQAT